MPTFVVAVVRHGSSEFQDGGNAVDFDQHGARILDDEGRPRLAGGFASISLEDQPRHVDDLS